MTEYEGKYLSEANHKKMKNTFIGIGIALIVFGALLIVGGVLLIVKGAGLIGTDMEDPDWFNKSSSGGGYLSGGVVMVAIALAFIFGGIALIVKAHTRELASFAVSSVAPIAKDTVGYASKEILPDVGTALGSVAGTVVNSFNKTKNATNICKKCGKENKKSSKFCASCGTKLDAPITRCSSCGAELESDYSFCPTCGKKVEK